MKILNLCSGNSPSTKEGVINVDADESCKPDVLLDLNCPDWPWKNNEINEIWLFHAMEHFCHEMHGPVMLRMNNVLKMGGRIIITYPEFKKCSDRYLSNANGDREFWEKTLYGRQKTIHDFHRAPIHSPYFKSFLIDYGFGKLEYMEESDFEPYNTIMKGIKVTHTVTREDVVAAEVFNVSL